ncbi:dapper homolog 3-like [Brachionichthys hirsutus]|uniref:dapper homolog 3-like n=1 Tax=Brachionichthys hirsutus TaxID=412623 RepID=UPI0036053706
MSLRQPVKQTPGGGLSSLPMEAERSRNKARMEASLAGLCELELLNQRQESRVRSALCLGDSPVPRRPLRGALRPLRCAPDAAKGSASENSLQASNLPGIPWATEASLEQQVADLNVNTEVYSTDLEDSYLSPGEVFEAKEKKSLESNDHILVSGSLRDPDGAGDTETGEKWLSDPTKQVTGTDHFGDMRNAHLSQEDNQQAPKLETYIFRLVQHSVLPTRLSKPRTSLTHDAQVISVVKQSTLCHKEEQHSLKQGLDQENSSSHQCSGVTNLKTNLQAYHNLDEELRLGQRFIRESTASHHCLLPKSVQQQPGVYHMQAPITNYSCSTLQDYPSSRVLQGHSDSSNCEPDSDQYFHKYPSPSSLLKPQQVSSPDEQLVNAEYIPAQPCRASSRAHVHAQSNPQEGSIVPKLNQIFPEKGHHLQEQQPTTSQMQTSRSRGASRNSRLNEDKSGASRKQWKKACKSQSQNSLPRVPGHKFNIVDRDRGESGRGGRGSQIRNKAQQLGGSSSRCWQSTKVLSQDEAEQTAIKGSSGAHQKDTFGRPQKSRPTRTTYGYSHKEYQLEKVQVQPYQPNEGHPQPSQGESESSMADSPDCSSLSSDSDESGGLVWPQQLPPQLSIPSLPPTPTSPGTPLQPKAFVKIKASQALKKKILRFHTGSLKVMTTV